ncbi:MAG: hypothetical protein LBT12_04420 [Oscillospiraceae bacterium]|jgi:hypothetical protein|nr:hypothetical protein [Oscillospiraceae bacterium]
MEFFYEDEITLPDVMRSTLVICLFTEREIDASDYERFERLVKTLDTCAMGSREKLLLQFDYGEDPQEVFEFAETCDFARGLFVRCPQLYYYLYPHNGFSGAFLLCMAGAGSVRVAREGITSLTPLLSTSLAKAVEDTRRALKDYGFAIGDPVGAMVALNNLGMLSREL